MILRRGIKLMAPIRALRHVPIRHEAIRFNSISSNLFLISYAYVETVIFNRDLASKAQVVLPCFGPRYAVNR
jgi:hypothetical protein